MKELNVRKKEFSIKLTPEGWTFCPTSNFGIRFSFSLVMSFICVSLIKVGA